MEEVAAAKSTARRIVDAFDSVTWLFTFGWGIILHRCACAVAILFCSPQIARSHLKIAKWAINPVGKKVVYASKFESSPCTSRFLLIVLAPVHIIFIYYMLCAIVLGTIFSCGRLYKFVTNLQAVSGATGELKIVDRNWMPPSVAQYDPSKKCRISLGTQNSKGDPTKRWVHIETNNIDIDGKLMADGFQCEIWDSFISEPVGNDRVTLQREKDGKYIGGNIRLCSSNPTRFRTVTHVDDTFVFANNYPVSCASDLSGLCAIRRTEGSGDDARTRYFLECSDTPTCWTVIVHEILDEASDLNVMGAAAPSKQQEQSLIIEKPISILEDSSGTKQAIIVDPPSLYKDPPPYAHVADVPPTYI